MEVYRKYLNEVIWASFSSMEGEKKKKKGQCLLKPKLSSTSIEVLTVAVKALLCFHNIHSHIPKICV